MWQIRSSLMKPDHHIHNVVIYTDREPISSQKCRCDDSSFHARNINILSSIWVLCVNGQPVLCTSLTHLSIIYIFLFFWNSGKELYISQLLNQADASESVSVGQGHIANRFWLISLFVLLVVVITCIIITVLVITRNNFCYIAIIHPPSLSYHSQTVSATDTSWLDIVCVFIMFPTTFINISIIKTYF